MNTVNTTSSLQRRSKALYSTVNLVMDPRPALSVINSNIKKVIST